MIYALTLDFWIFYHSSRCIFKSLWVSNFSDIGMAICISKQSAGGWKTTPSPDKDYSNDPKTISAFNMEKYYCSLFF